MYEFTVAGWAMLLYGVLVLKIARRALHRFLAQAGCPNMRSLASALVEKNVSCAVRTLSPAPSPVFYVRVSGALNA